MSDEDMDKLMQAGGGAGKTRVHERMGLDSRLEMAMDALRCPSGDTSVKLLQEVREARRPLRLLLSSPTFVAR